MDYALEVVTTARKLASAHITGDSETYTHILDTLPRTLAHDVISAVLLEYVPQERQGDDQ